MKNVSGHKLYLCPCVAEGRLHRALLLPLVERAVLDQVLAKCWGHMWTRQATVICPVSI